MGNCCSLFSNNKSKRNKDITVILTGLDDSGKTTMAKRLIGEPVENVLKTVGFSLIKLRHHKYNISLYDLGGSPQIREIWSKYYMDAHGVIYVVDASDVARLHESKLVFANLLSHENISGKPVLLLANKQDKETALDELDVVEQLDVEYIVNKYRCPTRVEICSALNPNNIKIDSSIISGYKWLIDIIIENYNVINDRVQVDMANYALLIQQDRDEWKKRVESSEDKINPEDEPVLKNGNPFVPIDSLIKNKPSDAKRSRKIENHSKHDDITPNNTVIQVKPAKTPIKGVLNRQVSSIKDAVRDQTEKLNQKYHRHKKKFVRFNKTAPMPMDILINNAAQSRLTVNVAVSTSSAKAQPSIRNYLQNRPKTAPSRLNPIKFKEAAWDLAAPLDNASSSNAEIFTVHKEASDSEDVVSFF
ncbi:ADP-ribosylation factor-like protein 13B [Planococcus citri]|uniref:ADP-ribosylation factor-like protein 13B n=1 Tax=Planococcus citri TaxID=170843 RepID=UPI0031F866D3